MMGTDMEQLLLPLVVFVHLISLCLAEYHNQAGKQHDSRAVITTKTDILPEYVLESLIPAIFISKPLHRC